MHILYRLIPTSTRKYYRYEYSVCLFFVCVYVRSCKCEHMYECVCVCVHVCWEPNSGLHFPTLFFSTGKVERLHSVLSLATVLGTLCLTGCIPGQSAHLIVAVVSLWVVCWEGGKSLVFWSLGRIKGRQVAFWKTRTRHGDGSRGLEPIFLTQARLLPHSKITGAAPEPLLSLTWCHTLSWTCQPRKLLKCGTTPSCVKDPFG